jgi:hypothetical protein
MEYLNDVFSSTANSIKTKLNTKEGIKPADFSSDIDKINTKGYTGHCDAEGLKQIGWTDEDIQNFQDYGVFWNEEDDEYFKLTESELAGDNSSSTRFLPKNPTKVSFYNYNSLIAVPKLDVSNYSSFSSTFLNCRNLRYINIDFSKNTKAIYYFTDTFAGCTLLNNIQLKLSTHYNLSLEGIFRECSSLSTVSEINTSSVLNFKNAFYFCCSLYKLCELNAKNTVVITLMFYKCYLLTEFGGLKDLGKAFIIETEHYDNYTLDLSYSNLLTHDSLMNVINKLYDLNLTYDVANGGTLYRQSLVLGSTNLAKLTDEEIKIATDKGWDVS